MTNKSALVGTIAVLAAAHARAMQIAQAGTTDTTVKVKPRFYIGEAAHYTISTKRKPQKRPGENRQRIKQERKK